jgi:hypothetical protein
VQLYDERSKGAEAYMSLAVELLGRNGIARPKAPKSVKNGLGEKQAPRFWPYSQ